MATVKKGMEKTVLHDESLAKKKDECMKAGSRAEGVLAKLQHKVELRRIGYPNGEDISKVTLKGPSHELAPGWTVSAVAESWQGNKDVQEDRFVMDMVLAGGKVLAYCVLDGHTGSKCVEYIHASLEMRLKAAFDARARSHPSEEMVKECTREALSIMDKDFAKLAKAHELADGTTCNILFFFTDASDVNLDGTIATKRKVVCANVGDTRSVLFNAVQYVYGVARVFTMHSINLNGRTMTLGLSVSRSL